MYLAILILISAFGVVEYQGPMDEEYYLREPRIIAISFAILSIITWVTTLLCGLPLIFILKKCGRLSSFSLLLGATILGAVVLPFEMAMVDVIFKGNVSIWGNALIWMIAIGAAAGCFTAVVFRMVVGIKDRNLSNKFN